VGPGEAHALWTAGELAIVDVREDDEIEITHIEGVPVIPMSEFLARIDELPEEPVALICRSGSRSGQIVDYLMATGQHDEAHNVDGGIIAWAAEGLPYEGEPPS
jgi:rhodanese-related sulfurtransferase